MVRFSNPNLVSCFCFLFEFRPKFWIFIYIFAFILKPFGEDCRLDKNAVPLCVDDKYRPTVD